MFKKPLKVLYLTLLGLFCLVAMEYARQGFINDISLQPVTKNNTPDLGSTTPVARPPVYLISYADGKEYVFRNQNTMAASALNKDIDFILNYRKSHIDQAFYHKNKDILTRSPGGGLWLWKPYIILKTLNSVPENALVIYMDAAFKIKQPLHDLLKHLAGNDIILVHDHGRKNGSFIKGDSFALTNCLSDECRQSPLIASGVIMLKNTARSREVMSKWLEYAEDLRIISGDNFNIHPNYPEFAWHHFDQSVLSLVYAKNPKDIHLIKFEDLAPYMAWFHRKPSKSSPNKPCYTVYGIEPVINFSTTGKTLPSSALLNLPPVVYVRKWILRLLYGEPVC